MRGFSFQDGTPTSARAAQYDNLRDGRSGGWTRADFVYAINVHQRAFGARQTSELLYRLFGTTDPENVPWYVYGPIIAACAESMAQGKPHNVPRAHAASHGGTLPPPQRRPYA